MRVWVGVGDKVFRKDVDSFKVVGAGGSMVKAVIEIGGTAATKMG